MHVGVRSPGVSSLPSSRFIIKDPGQQKSAFYTFYYYSIPFRFLLLEYHSNLVLVVLSYLVGLARCFLLRGLVVG